MSSRDQAKELLKRLGEGPKVGCEIGIHQGRMSAELLKRENLTLLMVDNWRPVKGLEHLGFTDEGQLKNKADALHRTEFASSRRIVLHQDSDKACLMVEDKSLDFVFIDGDHSYQGVKTDIKNWLPKIKSYGILSGHDYGNSGERFGAEVKRAVDEFVEDSGLSLDLGEDHTWFVKL